mgnify:FL=1
MAESLVITFVGVDRPGIVQDLTAMVHGQQGNWLESKMSRMAGKFAGIALIEVSRERLDALKEELQGIPDVSVIVEMTDTQDSDAGMLSYQLNIVGLDRQGILQEVTNELSRKNINVIELETRVNSAPMSGDKMFHADASVLVPSSVDLIDLHDRLDAVTDDLGVDILLELSN